MLTPIVSIPPSERVGWYRSMQRFACEEHSDKLYADLHLIAGCWMRLANKSWPNWPPQEPEPDTETPVTTPSYPEEQLAES